MGALPRKRDLSEAQPAPSTLVDLDRVAYCSKLQLPALYNGDNNSTSLQSAVRGFLLSHNEPTVHPDLYGDVWHTASDQWMLDIIIITINYYSWFP